MIHATLHGFHWTLVYWLVVSLAGLVLGVSNVRHVLAEARSIRRGEADEVPLRAQTLGQLILHAAIGLASVVTLYFGLDLQAGAFKPAGLIFTFQNFESEVIVIVIGLLLPTIPAGIAAGLWLQRWWTVRAL